MKLVNIRLYPHLTGTEEAYEYDGLVDPARNFVSGRKGPIGALSSVGRSFDDVGDGVHCGVENESTK